MLLFVDAAPGELCDCCMGQLTYDNVTDDNEPCPYQCSYETAAPRVKRQLPEFLAGPRPPPVRQQSHGNARMHLFHEHNTRFQQGKNQRGRFSFNGQATQLGDLPDNERDINDGDDNHINGHVDEDGDHYGKADDNDSIDKDSNNEEEEKINDDGGNHDGDNYHDEDDNGNDEDDDNDSIDKDSDDDDDDVEDLDLSHCRPVGQQPQGRPPPQSGQPLQGGPPPKRGPPPNGQPPPPKMGAPNSDCTLNGLRLVGRRRKRAATAALEALLKKFAHAN